MSVADNKKNIPCGFPQIELLEKSHLFNMAIITRHHRSASQEKLRQCTDITLEMLCALEVIHSLQPLPQQQLANSLMCDRSAAKRTVDNLIKRGLANVSKDESNRKHKIISLSDEGEIERKKGKAIMQETSQDYLSPLDEEEKVELMRLCKKILNGENKQQ